MPRARGIFNLALNSIPAGLHMSFVVGGVEGSWRRLWRFGVPCLL